MVLRVDDATAVGALAGLVSGLLPRPGAPVVVCLDGRSGSGKTTLARRLSRSLRDGATSVTVLHLDHVYPGWDGLDDAVRLLGDDLLPRLRAGEPASYPSWSWVRDRPGPVVEVRPADVVLVEGVGSGGRAARRSTDLLVWLEAPTPLRYSRAMARDGDGYAPHWDRWAAQEQTYLVSEAPAGAADVVVVASGPSPREDEGSTRSPGVGPSP